MERTRRMERRRRERRQRILVAVIGTLVVIALLLLLARWAFSPADIEAPKEESIPPKQEEVAKEQPGKRNPCRTAPAGTPATRAGSLTLPRRDASTGARSTSRRGAVSGRRATSARRVASARGVSSAR